MQYALYIHIQGVFYMTTLSMTCGFLLIVFLYVRVAVQHRDAPQVHCAVHRQAPPSIIIVKRNFPSIHFP